jgi:hypothetical protein
MDLEEYALLLGRVIGNLHALEFSLRAFLYAKNDPPHAPPPWGPDMNSMRVAMKSR